MSDPRRLLDAGTDFERALLRGWKDERASGVARVRLLALAGLTALAATGARWMGAAGGSTAPKAANLGGPALAKWLVLGAIAAIGAVAIGVGGLHGARPSTSPVQIPMALLVAPTQAPPAPLAATPIAQPPSVDGTPLPSAVAPPPLAVARRAPSTLGDQVAAMDRARTALEADDSLLGPGSAVP
jgi:hypothetical protein